MKKHWMPLIIGFFVTLFIILLIFAFVILLPKDQTSQPQNAEITIIAASTSTPMMSLTIIPTPTIGSTDIPVGYFKFQIGDYAQITGTSGDGLRLRSGPSRADSVNFIGLDSEVFEVVDGPVEADGFIWWYLEAPYDKTRNGWSVDEYLQLVNVP